MRGKVFEAHGELGERVIAGNGRAIRRQDEGDGDMLLEILSSSFVEVIVQRFNAAGKGISIVGRIKRLSKELWLVVAASQTSAPL